MVKKKAKKKVSKKSPRTKKTVKRKTTRKKSSKSNWMTRSGWTFVNLLLLVTFLYGLWITWDSSWKEGLSIIFTVALVIFFIKLFLKLKRK